MLFCSPDNLVLQRLSQVVEIVTVPGHPDDQVPVFLRVFLRIPQGARRNHVKLDVVAHHAEVASYQLGDLVNRLLIPEEVRGKYPKN